MVWEKNHTSELVSELEAGMRDVRKRREVLRMGSEYHQVTGSWTRRPRPVTHVLSGLGFYMTWTCRRKMRGPSCLLLGYPEAAWEEEGSPSLMFLSPLLTPSLWSTCSASSCFRNVVFLIVACARTAVGYCLLLALCWPWVSSLCGLRDA